MTDTVRILICALPCICSLLCFLSIAMRWGKRNGAQRMLAILLLLSFVGSFYFFIFQVPEFKRSFRTDWLLTCCYAFMPSVYYIFICRLTNSDRKSHIWSMAVPVTLVFINLVLYIAMGDKSSGDYMEQVKPAWPVEFGAMPFLWKVKYVFSAYVFRAVVIIQFLLAVGVTSGRIYRFHSELKEFYSDAETKFFRSWKMLAYSGVTFLLSSVLLTFGPYHLYNVGIYYVIIGVSLGIVSLICLTAYGLNQPVTAETLAAFTDETKNIGTATKNRGNLKERLNAAIDEEFFVAPDITIMDISEKLGTNADYLSELIHLTYGLSFADFVNDLRIKKAIQEMRSVPVNSPLTRVANICGYGTYSEFAYNFEKFAHLTPSEWMKRYR